jgi:hypothetical protein
VEILFWLLPSVVVTCAAMAWVGWVGRERPERERSDVELERLARAVMRPIPEEHRHTRPRERSTGIAQRRAAQRSEDQSRDSQRRDDRRSA